MSFKEKNLQLLSLYRLQHDLSNHIDGASFAEDKGLLTEEEQTDLLLNKTEFEGVEKQVLVLREELLLNYPKEYIDFLTLMHKNLTSIQKQLSTAQGEVTFKTNFNKTLCHSLLQDFSKLIQGKTIKNPYYWLFDVAQSLQEEYPQSL